MRPLSITVASTEEGGKKASIVLHIVATISPFEFLIMIHYFSSNQLN